MISMNPDAFITALSPEISGFETLEVHLLLHPRKVQETEQITFQIAFSMKFWNVDMQKTYRRHGIFLLT